MRWRPPVPEVMDRLIEGLADALALRSWSQWVNDLSDRVAEESGGGTTP